MGNPDARERDDMKPACQPAEVEIGVLKEQVGALQKMVEEQGDDIKAIRSKTDKWHGVVGLLVLAIPALVGAVVGWLLHK